MNTPNPISPLGTLTPANAGKSNVRIAVITIIALHAVFFGGLLLQGCKPKPTEPQFGGAGGRGTTSSGMSSELPPFTPTNTAGFGADTNRGLAGQPSLPGAISNAVPAVPYTPPYVPPADAAVQPAQPAAATQEYVVKAGDTPARIAKAHGIPLNALMSANPGLEPRRLKIGQKIQVPPPPPATGTSGGTVGGTEPGAGGETLKVHVVQKGDTLSKIAHANGVTPKDLRAVNKLKTDRINVGQKIKIPPAKPSPAGTTAAAGTAAGR